MEFFVILILILLNGIFSMSEIAIVSARKTRLESAAKRGDKGAEMALKTANAPNRFLSTVQIGITLIGILTGIFSGENITNDLEHFFTQYESLAGIAHTLAVTIVVVAITFFSLVLGELLPKRIGLTNPEGIAKTMAGPMNFLTLITSPFVWLLTFTTDSLVKILGVKPSTDSKVTEEEIKAIIQEGKEGGEIEEIEQDIVERVFSLGDRNVASLMSHRSSLVYLKENYTKDQIREIVLNEMHSIYPVMDDRNEVVVGVIALKSLFKHLTESNFDLRQHLTTPQYIHENMSAYEALVRFKTSGSHFGVVIDEFGQLQGVITLNDMLEALVGDVSEFYSEEFSFVEREDGTWLVDGQYPLADFLSRFDLEDMISEYSVSTVSGLILHELRSVPKPGMKVQWMQFELEVIDMDRARIDKVLVKRLID